jgi:hypothetical protein
MPSDEINNSSKPSRTQVLIENYRESRQEANKLVHSVFSDIAFSVALLGAIFTGGLITDEPKLLLLIPFLLGGIGIYEVQKLRVNNLITCYMIYLEKEINKDYPQPIMIWNSEFIRRNVSAGRQSKWGQALLFFGIIVIGIIYGGICYWSAGQNTEFFKENFAGLYIYLAGCILVFIFNILGIVGSLSVTKKYSPEYIEKLVKSREIQYIGDNRKKRLFNKKH